jgi:hypothetical protein
MEISKNNKEYIKVEIEPKKSEFEKRDPVSLPMIAYGKNAYSIDKLPLGAILVVEGKVSATKRESQAGRVFSDVNLVLNNAEVIVEMN